MLLVAPRSCVRVCGSARSPLTIGTSTRRSTYSFGDWQCTGFWNIAWGALYSARTWCLSSRRFPTIGRDCRNWAIRILSYYHGSLTCGGVPAKWSWNRPALVRCSKSAIQRSRA